MKALLVIDMPMSCRDCPFTSQSEESECMALIYSKRTHHLNSYEYWHDEKADICPLKPLPSKLVPFGYLDVGNEDGLYEKGYNDCVDEITGETE